MSWVKLDDGVADAPEMLAAGPVAFSIAMWAISYSARHLTDGAIDLGVLKGCPWVTRLSALNRACEALEVAGFWQRTSDGYAIVDPFQYLQKSDEVREKRAANAQRQADWRERQRQRRNGGRNSVTADTRNAPPDPTPKGEGRPTADTSPKGAPAAALAPAGSPPPNAQVPTIDLADDPTVKLILRGAGALIPPGSHVCDGCSLEHPHVWLTWRYGEAIRLQHPELDGDDGDIVPALGRFCPRCLTTLGAARSEALS